MKLSDLFERHGHRGRGDSWAILPATMSLYNKRTVDIITAASAWDDETILVCKNEQGKTKFVGTSGSFEEYEKLVGTSHMTHHDQTMASKGKYAVVNVVHIEKGEIKKKVNDVGLKEKASLSVFK